MPNVDTLPDGTIRLTSHLNVAIWDAFMIAFTLTVPAGFVSDGASIPKILWPILGSPIGNRHLPAAIVHDFLCESATSYEQRVIGDAVFFELLKRCDVPYWRRAAMYCGVRFYARFIWKPKQVTA